MRLSNKNICIQLASSLALGLISTIAGAQSITDVAASTPTSAYGQDTQGNVARTQYGLCWRTGYWTPTDSVTGCDGELAPPVAKTTAPPIVTNPHAIAIVPAAAQNACDFNLTLGEKETFPYGKFTLNPAAKNKISGQIIDKLASCSRVAAITITGHADRLGFPEQNNILSLKRAEAVAAFLKSKNVATPITIVAAGSNAPLTDCPGNVANVKLIACLAPNRRVVISVQGYEK